MKSEKMMAKAKKKAIVLVICTVFLVAVSGVFVAASTSEDVSSGLTEVDYSSSEDVNETSPLLYVSSINVTEEPHVSSTDVKEAYQELQNASLLGYAESGDCWLKYDDGLDNQATAWRKPDFGWAVHFTNTCPGSNLKKALFALAPYNKSKGFEELRWEVREWTGSEPGSVIKSGTTTPTGVGWHEVAVGVTVSEDFVIELIDPAGLNAWLFVDNSTPIDDRSWEYYPIWDIWDKQNDLSPNNPVDFMIRAVISTENGENGDPKLCTIPDPPSHDFGSVPVNEAESWTFDIKNIGLGSLEWSVKKDKEWIGVSPSAGETTTGTDTVGVKVDTYNMTVGETYTGHITVTSTIGGTETGTIKVTPSPTSDTVITVKTDNFKYCPGDTMRISVNISNPTIGDLLFEWYGVKVERDEGTPLFSLWMPVDNRTISGDETIEEDVPIVDEGSEPFEILLYARLVDPGTGQVLAADSTCCVYCPTGG